MASVYRSIAVPYSFALNALFPSSFSFSARSDGRTSSAASVTGLCEGDGDACFSNVGNENVKESIEANGFTGVLRGKFK